MAAAPLRSVPTGHSDAGLPGLDVDLASETLDAELEPALAVRTTAVVVAASLLDFLR